jgi:Undecaprenyl-phosphate glucose phosphotransferase
MRLLSELSDTPVDIRLAPELLRFEFLQQRAEWVAGIPLLRVLDRPVSGARELLKTAEDRILGSLLLLAVAPVMLVVALAIKLDSPGPVFFRQTRYGFNNNLIKVWKFRTMYHHLTDAAASVLTQRDDPRVTRVGRFLRRTSLDELPQLLNVVHGEMSLVGPRPQALQAKAGDQLYQDVMHHYAARHRVKPGLTGWAQVNGWRGETDTCEKLTKRVEHDLYYIDNWSLWLDLQILLRTVWVVLTARNAY